MRKLLFAIVVAITLFGLTAPMATPAMAATTTLNPNASGFATNLFRGAGTSNWNACSSSDGDTSFVGWGGTSWKYDLYNLADPVSPTGTINSVIVYFEARAVPTPTQPSAQTVIRIGTTNYYGGTSTTIGGGTTLTLTTSYVATYSYTYSTKPGGGSWGWSDINGLQAGVALRSANGVYGQAYESRCTRVWVVVNYTSGNNPPVADAKTVSTDEDIALGITLSGSDVETVDLTFSIVILPAHGTLSSISNNPGTTGSPNTDTASVTYTPAADYSGSDSFTFKASDGVADSNIATVSITVTTASITVTAPELLGRPTDTSITVNVVLNGNGQVYFEYGITSGDYPYQTDTAALTSNTPTEVVIGGLLTSNTKYYYRMVYRQTGETEWSHGDEHSFRTQRSPGSTFTFTIISDSHMNGGGGNVAQYEQTLDNVNDDNPDFHLDLGDTFWMDGVTSSTVANQRYLQQRVYMGTISHSAAIFVATGNHENEEGWNFDDTNSKALLSVNARKLYYPNPIPDGFYTGNTDVSLGALAGDGLREDYYAWEWGDALFVVIDPYQYTMTKPYAGSPGGEDNDETVIGDRWDWTLGQQQFNWFKQTLETSDATFKFVFAHHMVGGSQDYVRGGAGPAHLFEWGGYNADGTTWGFDTERPGWDDPIHQLMIDNGVSAFFHGHDHEYAYEERDGIVYQLVPAPSMTGYGFGLYNESDPYTIRVLPSPGHLRVTVSPTQVTVDYVQTSDGTVAYSYTIMAGSVNNPPAANNQSVTTNEDTAKAVTLTATDVDGDTLSYSIVAPPTHGALSGTPPNVTYMPVGNYNGPDSFTFKASDGVADSNIATVSIAVLEKSDPPNQPTLIDPDNGGVDISTHPALEVVVSDPDADPLDVTFYGREAGAGADEDFTVIVLPDTQLYSQSYPDIFTAQTQWVVNNRNALDIVYVAHEGDIVNTASSTTQWNNANSAMGLLENPATTGLPQGISYGVLPGNHDQPTTNYNSYFGVSRFAGRGYYGGHYSSTNDNNYTLFSAAGMDFIVINLQYVPTTAMLDWADSLLKTYSGRQAIVVSHYIINTNNSWGQEVIFTSLQDNPNLFLMLCGHMHSGADGEGQRTETGEKGNTIYVLLANYQDYTNGGNGYLRILQFSPADDEISVKTYSPYSGLYETDADSQFVLAYEMEGSEDFVNLGTVSDVTSGDNASIIWPDLASGTTYEWYVEVSDGSQTTAGPIWSFITGGSTNNPPTAPSNLAATAVSTTQINLSWQDNSGDETGFRIERKTGTSGTYAQIDTTNANITTYNNNGLSPSTTYYYRVRAYNANGDSAYSNEASATTQSPPSNNLALNKLATADSEQTSGGNTANKGNDGNSSTRWSANDGRWNHWWKVDLGNTYTLTSTKVQFQFARNYRYKIEVSTDNISWTIVANQTATTSTAQTREDSFSATLGRYVRITYTRLPWFPTTWASHYEFEVYGN